MDIKLNQELENCKNQPLKDRLASILKIINTIQQDPTLKKHKDSLLLKIWQFETKTELVLPIQDLWALYKNPLCTPQHIKLTLGKFVEDDTSSALKLYLLLEEKKIKYDKDAILYHTPKMVLEYPKNQDLLNKVIKNPLPLNGKGLTVFIKNYNSLSLNFLYDYVEHFSWTLEDFIEFINEIKYDYHKYTVDLLVSYDLLKENHPVEASRLEKQQYSKNTHFLNIVMDMYQKIFPDCSLFLFIVHNFSLDKALYVNGENIKHAQDTLLRLINKFGSPKETEEIENLFSIMHDPNNKLKYQDYFKVFIEQKLLQQNTLEIPKSKKITIL